MSESKNGFSPRREPSKRPQRTSRPSFSNDRGDRPARPFSQDRPSRPSFSNDRGDRPARPFSQDRPSRPSFSNDRGDRPARPFSQDRPARPSFSNDRSDRPARPFSNDRSDRPARPFSNDRGDRPARPFSQDRPSRPSFSNDRSDRPARPFSQDRPSRPSFSNDRSDRPARPFSQDRPSRPSQDRSVPSENNFSNDRKSTPSRGGFSANRDRVNSRDNGFGDRAAKPRSFGNKKSMFLSKEEREAVNAPQKVETKNSIRHLDPQARIDDRARASDSLAKARLVRNAGGNVHRPGSNERRRMASSIKKDDRDGERLNKFIAHSGVCSRRDADMYIRSGSVEVNGVVVAEMGYKVLPTDVVKFDGVELKTEKKVYVLLNKPKNFITTTDDPEKRRTVMELVKNATKERIYPVGRLDRSTMGLLLFTNDGEMAKRIMHPSSNIKKIYHATLDRNLTANDMGKIREGVELEDGIINVDSISYIPGEAHKELGIELHSGKNRIVRRIFEHLEYEVVKLDRVQLGPLTKKNLARGQWRLLTKEEVNMLMMVNKAD